MQTESVTKKYTFVYTYTHTHTYIYTFNSTSVPIIVYFIFYHYHDDMRTRHHANCISEILLLICNYLSIWGVQIWLIIQETDIAIKYTSTNYRKFCSFYAYLWQQIH
jgi:hypothetical protein